MTTATLDPAPAPTDTTPAGDTWLEVALHRLQSDGSCPVDPAAAVATFNSAW